MSRWNWTPIRYVAENISAGDRSYWNLMKIPELETGRISAAISELEEEGLITVTGWRVVEPTEAFHVWFADFRQRRDQTSVRQPVEPPKADPPKARPQKPPVSTRTVTRKRYFAHLSADRYQAGMEMAARIKETIEAMGRRTMTLSALKRSLHANRHPAAWKEAIRRLVVHRIATVADGNITLKWSEFELPNPYGRLKPKRHERNRGQSEWFEKNRAKMDDGQHSDFDEDWSGEDDSAAAEAFWRQLDKKDEDG